MGQHLLFSTWILPNKILNRYSYVWKSVILGKLSFYCIWKRAGGGYAFQKFWHVHFLLFDAFVWLYYYSLYLFLDYASFQIGFLKYELNIWSYWKSKIFSLWQNVWLVIFRHDKNLNLKMNFIKKIKTIVKESKNSVMVNFIFIFALSGNF